MGQPASAADPTVTVIIPFHRRLEHLERSLGAVRTAMPLAQVIVAADGAVEDCRPLAQIHHAEVVPIAGPLGPAAARNYAARQATGSILAFVDADVVVAPDALALLSTYLLRHSAVAGVFGAYDEEPAERNFTSRYKNLSHSYIHQRANQQALTFWAGLGAVRASAFRSVGGFNEGFRRPSVEDIELGYRLVAEGHQLAVEPRARGCHLKRWTLAGSVVTDVRDRGIPWTQLILRNRALTDDLNTTAALRWSVVLSYLCVISAIGAWFSPLLGVVAVSSLAGVLVLNRDYYAWFRAQQGAWFATKVFGAHVLHHLCNGVSFLAGAVIWAGDQIGVKLPGRVPRRQGSWSA